MPYETELELESEFETEFEGEAEFEGEFEGEGWLGAVGNALGGLFGESESEFEGEAEGESEAGLNPIRKIYADAMMEHLGELAAEAESEQEAAEHFLPLIGMAASKLLPIVAKAAAPLARKALPQIVKAVSRVAPQLTRSVGKIARTLHHNPQTRHLLRAVPSVARRTVGSIAKQAAKGQHITPRAAVHTLATQARNVLRSPAARSHALRRHHALERRLHTRWARGMVRPHLTATGMAQGRRPAAHGTAAHRSPAAMGGAISGAPGMRSGQMVGGRCVCAACPSCGSSVPAQPAVNAAPAPAYCRCCGQVLR